MNTNATRFGLRLMHLAPVALLAAAASGQTLTSTFSLPAPSNTIGTIQTQSTVMGGVPNTVTDTVGFTSAAPFPTASCTYYWFAIHGTVPPFPRIHSGSFYRTGATLTNSVSSWQTTNTLIPAGGVIYVADLVSLFYSPHTAMGWVSGPTDGGGTLTDLTLNSSMTLESNGRRSGVFLRSSVKPDDHGYRYTQVLINATDSPARIVWDSANLAEIEVPAGQIHICEFVSPDAGAESHGYATISATSLGTTTILSSAILPLACPPPATDDGR